MDKGKNAYLVLGYACNHHCSCCPCGKDDISNGIRPIEDIKRDIEKISSMGILDVTVSGGEPTLHPNFIEIIDAILSKGIAVHILSNGDKFSDLDFSDRFIEVVSNRSVSVTTTFHSVHSDIHESQNGSVGSFKRTLSGLKYLDSHNISISIKQCLTSLNYRDFQKFVEFVFSEFSSNCELQIWSIDLCGIKQNDAYQIFTPFLQMKPYIESGLDWIEKHQINGDPRVINLNNIPLCMCDCYYWKYFSSNDRVGYLDYNIEERYLNSNSGANSKHCKKCPLAKVCQGTYNTIFEIIGDDVVSVPEIFQSLQEGESIYIRYNTNNISNIYFSPNAIYRLTTKGLIIINTLTKEQVRINCKESEIKALISMLTKGSTEKPIRRIIGNYLCDELLRKGVIE